MSALSGFVGGVLGLSLLEAVVSSSQATGRVGGLFDSASNVLAHLASPDVPAIPDLRTGAAATTTAYLAPVPSGGGTPTAPTLAPTTRPRSVTPTRFANV